MKVRFTFDDGDTYEGNIEYLDGWTRFHVWSETNPKHEPYLVDLEENLGVGRCDCSQFRCRLAPAIIGKDRSETARERKRCKHIKACRRLLGMDLAHGLIQSNLQKAQPTNGHD